MTISNRNVTIKSIFATNANTTIPNPPVAGASYRNESVTTQEIAAGWAYKEIVDSAKFNEAMYEYTTICKLLEEYGFLPWSANTDYPAGGCALGTDGKVYQAKQPTGPSTSSIDPVTDTSHTYWDLFYYATVTANRALVSNSSGKMAVSSTTATELGYVHGVTSAIQTQLNSKAADNAVVKLSGNQTITGTKTFSNTISGSINGNAATVTNGVYTTGTQTIGGSKTFSNRLTLEQNDPGMFIKNTGYTKGVTPSAERWEGIEWQDSGGRTVARVRHRYTTGKDCYIEFQAFRSHLSTDTESATFSLEYPATNIPTVKSPQLQPDEDNTHNLGVAEFRWKQLYAGTTTIATSDEREKQNIDEIPDEVLDAWGEVQFYQFKFKDAVAEKGEENARYHTGLIAQRIESVFAAHGLDAHKYGLLCYDEWEAQAAEYDENGDEITPARAAGNRYALRYEECLTMEAAYQRRRADRIEARLTALEARL